MRTTRLVDGWLAAAVGVHLLITLLHGAAHQGAQIGLTPAGNAFVLIVIVIGPLAGLALSFAWPTLGAWVVAASMAGALVFGLVNHFVISSPDHVSHVAGPWRSQFVITAGLLVLTEIAGVMVGVRSATSPVRNGLTRATP